MSHSALGSELHLLDPAVRADGQALEALLHRDFLEIGSGGQVWTREESIAALVADPAVGGRAEGMEVDELAYGNALVTYTLGDVRRSSIWIREAGRWQLRFHQATPIAMSETR
jgi:ribonuclease HI